MGMLFIGGILNHYRDKAGGSKTDPPCFTNRFFTKMVACTGAVWYINVRHRFSGDVKNLQIINCALDKVG